MNGAWVVLRKELVDALRDRRTLATVLLSAVAVGPLVLVLLSWLVADVEQRAEARELWVQGIDHAPSLHNYLRRQTWVVHAADADHAAALRERRRSEPLLVVTPGFERELAQGRAPALELLSSSSDPRADAAAARIAQLLAGFNHEQATLRLAVRGVAPALLEAVRIEPRDLADPAQRAAQWMGMVPFFVLMAVLYGALNAALDTTAGERERGSLEPLLTNPTSPAALVLGKWGAVAVMAMGVALLSALGFLPGQWLLRSETLAALFRYGLREAALFLALLLPLAGAVSALLMAISIRCRSVKEAQASTTVVVLAVSLLPLATLFDPRGEQTWHLWVPGLAQSALMARVLKAQPLAADELLLPLAVCAVLTVVALAALARTLRRDGWR